MNASSAQAAPASCEICREMYALEPEGPPCETCVNRTVEVENENILAINVWQICASAREVMSVPISGSKKVNGQLTNETRVQFIYRPLAISEIKAAIELYDGTREDFEKVITVEQTVYPHLNKRGPDHGD